MTTAQADGDTRAVKGFAITVMYDHAAWPVGGYYAYDESTYDGAPDSNGPMGYGRTEADAIEELAAQCLSKAPWEDMTPADLDRAQSEAEAGDEYTLAFITHLREHIQ